MHQGTVREATRGQWSLHQGSCPRGTRAMCRTTRDETELRRGCAAWHGASSSAWAPAASCVLAVGAIWGWRRGRACGAFCCAWCPIHWCRPCGGREGRGVAWLPRECGVAGRRRVHAIRSIFGGHAQAHTSRMHGSGPRDIVVRSRSASRGHSFHPSSHCLALILPACARCRRHAGRGLSGHHAQTPGTTCTATNLLLHPSFADDHRPQTREHRLPSMALNYQHALPHTSTHFHETSDNDLDIVRQHSPDCHLPAAFNCLPCLCFFFCALCYNVPSIAPASFCMRVCLILHA